jgi:hypothetical protein
MRGWICRVINQVARKDLMPMGAQYVDDGTTTTGWLPDPQRQALDPQQRLHGNSGRLIE